MPTVIPFYCPLIWLLIYANEIFQARQNEEDDVRTIDSAVGSGSVGESTSLNIDVQSEASDTTVSCFLVIKVLEMKALFWFCPDCCDSVIICSSVEK